MRFPTRIISGAIPPPTQAPIVVYNVLSLLALVRANIGITILPKLSVSEPQADVGFVPIDEPDATRTVGVITRAGEVLSPATAALLKSYAISCTKSPTTSRSR